MARIGISNRFFSQVKADYSDWQFALVREALQNCIDSGAKNIEFQTFRDDEGNTVFIFQNDGAPMSREVLEGKLLNLGETGKGFEDGSVGGFGRAKELLYFTHQSYKISSGDLQVEGSGGEYEVSIADESEYLKGTWSRVVIEGNEVAWINQHIHFIASCLQWRGNLSLNGEVIETRLSRGRTRITYEWARVSTTSAISHQVIVRIGGIPMFTFHTDYHGGVVVELSGNSGQVLTSNRDGLRWQYRDELNRFLNNLAVDRRSALRERNYTSWFRYGGERLGYVTKANTVVQEALGAALVALVESQVQESPKTSPSPQRVTEPVNQDLTPSTPEPSVSEAETETYTQVGCSRVKHEFVIKSELRRKVPKAYQGYYLSAHAQWLIRVWARCLVEIHNLTKTEGTFAVGFVFESENQNDAETSVLALHETHEQLGNVYLLNPVEWFRAQDGKLRMASRWAKNDRYALLAIACHEYVHFLGFKRHDEDYAAKLTEVMGLVFAENKRFAKCFK